MMIELALQQHAYVYKRIHHFVKQPRAYYNEIDKQAAKWLRELARRNLIMPGEVDDRSIVDVSCEDLKDFTQHHFFAGIGVWSHALRAAGWPDYRPVFTGSPPCQPFSIAGQRKGLNDDRHLWPVFFNIIRQFNPRVVFGEQVSSADALAWLDPVQSDMENAGYAFGAFDLCSPSVGAPHVRPRLFFAGTRNVANTYGEGRQGSEWCGSPASQRSPRRHPAERGCASDTGGGYWSDAEWLQCADQRHRPVEPRARTVVDGSAARMVRLRGYGNGINGPLATEFIGAYLDAERDGFRP